MHSNVDPLSRLPRIPEAVSPIWDDIVPLVTQSLNRDPAQGKLWNSKPKERTAFIALSEEVEHHPELQGIPTTEWDTRNEQRGGQADELAFGKRRSQRLVHLDSQLIRRFKRDYQEDPAFRTYYPEKPRSLHEGTAPHYFIGRSGSLLVRGADGKGRP